MLKLAKTHSNKRENKGEETPDKRFKNMNVQLVSMHLGVRGRLVENSDSWALSVAGSRGFIFNEHFPLMHST